MTLKSGWCLDGHHDGCRGTFSYGECPCDCHKNPVIEALASALNDRADLAALVITTIYEEINHETD
jgi:hypothetical protein